MGIDVRRVVDFFTVNWALKLTALALAFLLWTAVKAEQPVVYTIDDVPVRVDNRDGGWVLTRPPVPSTVSVRVVGPARELLGLAFERPEVLVPIEAVTDSTEIMVIRTHWVRFFGNTDNVSVDDIRPSTVRLSFDRVITKLVQLAPQLTGTPVRGYELAGPVEVDPPALRVSGTSGMLAALDTIRLPPIDLSARSVTDTQVVAVDTTGLGVVVSPRQVQVIIPIRPISADTTANPAGIRPSGTGGH